MQKAKGFSLIELMVVVAILGIFAAIATPSYVNYIKNAKQDEVKGLMMRTANDLGLWRSRALTYRGFVPDSGYLDASNLTFLSENGGYTVTLCDPEAASKSSLKANDAVGRSWEMYTENSDSNSNYYMNSKGVQCKIFNNTGYACGDTIPCNLSDMGW